MNKFIFVGNITRDPELATTASGTNVCQLSIAIKSDYKNKDGEYGTDFLNVTVWSDLAERCNKYLKKGSKVLVEGRVTVSSYETQDGTKKKNINLVGNNVEFLSAVSGSGTNKETASTTTNTPAELEEIDTDNLPF